MKTKDGWKHVGTSECANVVGRRNVGTLEVEKSKRQRGRRVLGLKDVTPRRDEKSAEVIDKQRVVRRPSRKRVSKPLKRKDLNEKKAEMEVAWGRAGRDLRVANTRHNSTKVYRMSITLLPSFEWDGKTLKSPVVTSGMREAHMQVGKLGTRAK